MPAVANPAIEAKYGPVVGIVDSSSEPDTKYEVRHNVQTGGWSCQCLGYRFNRYCKHIAATQADLGQALTQGGKKHVAAPKVKLRAPQVAMPQRATAPVDAQVHVEAGRLANEFGMHSGWPVGYRREAQEKIEAAIRKFMGAVVSAVAPVAVPVTMGSGIRMITLDE